jgi:putative addiction module component (TIGR02574 family)
MMPTKQVLLETVLTLSEKDRFELVEQLLESLSPPGGNMTGKEWKAELNRRWREYQADPSSAVAWEEVRKKARKES